MFGVSKQAYYKARKEPTDETKVLVEEIIVKYCEDVRQKDPNIGASCRAGQVCRYPFRQSFKAPTKEKEAKDNGFSAQLAHVSELDKGCNTQPTLSSVGQRHYLYTD
mgnify:CR=1 FL=1